MKSRLLIAFLLIAFVISGMAGCYQMGKATGETKRAVKESVQDFKEGYHQGERE